MAEAISTETRGITINDRNVYISIITYNELVPEDEATTATVMKAYQTLAEEFLSKPDIDNQKSACLITNLTPIKSSLTKEAVEAWYGSAKEDSLQTQKMLYGIFNRPTFSIVTLPGIDESYVRQQEYKINPNANPTYIVGSFEEATELAQQLLKTAHS